MLKPIPNHHHAHPALDELGVSPAEVLRQAGLPFGARANTIVFAKADLDRPFICE
jgi:hypothetical protein